MHSTGFQHVADSRAKVLILGTLPGQVSLLHQQYYAQPQNQFWRIMGEFVGAHPSLPYADRLQRLQDHGIALWDVCAAAHRPGSLDASITGVSVVPNAFAEFFCAYPTILSVFFNGQKAEALYRRHVLPTAGITYTTLPSTSPAHAAMPFERKLEAWSWILPCIGLQRP
jgi:double-stranded uracil-DNA glycosylase